MELGYFIAIIVVIAVGFFLLYRALKPKEQKDEGQGMLLIQQQLQESRREMNETVMSISEQMRKSLVDVTREQTKTIEQTRQFVTIAEQLANLEKTLKHQKQRGNLGELSLELILSNMLSPGQYSLQHKFKNGETVDAIITTKEGI